MVNRTTIVLAMHGAPPSDFPPGELAEFFRLHSQMESGPSAQPPGMPDQYRALEARLRAWPRDDANDPFHAGSLALASKLQEAAGLPVLVGFNEFCAPSLELAFDAAVAGGARQVVVVTPMMTSGGEHSELEIPEAIQHARSRHPDVSFRYAWPFPPGQVASFLAHQVKRYLAQAESAERVGGNS